MCKPLKSLLVVGILATVGWTGCAGPKLGDVRPLPRDLPPDLQVKFEVLEVETQPQVQPSPSASPLPVDLEKKKKVQAKKKKEPLAFVYPNRRGPRNPVWIGEKQVLEITYIGLVAGDFTAQVLPQKLIGHRKVYHLKANAVSSSMLNLFYRLNDTIESFWDYEGLFSHRFHMVLDQKKQKRDALELFDSEAKRSFYWNRRNHVEKGFTETKDYFENMIPFPQDSFSALYYLRTLPLENGKTYTFPVISEGKGWEAVVSVVRRESCDTPMGKTQCVVVRPRTRYQGVMRQEKGESYIWLTDDERRFIARLEAQVKIGSVAARLKEVEPGVPPSEN